MQTQKTRVRFRAIAWGAAVATAAWLLPSTSDAGYVELSLGFNYSRSNYTDNNYSWTRRWGLNAGYHFTDTSEVEFGFQDALDRTKITGYEDTTFHDRIFSVTWVQALTGKDFPVQPFVKLGVGQLNREATGTYTGGVSPPRQVDSVTAVLGGGLRLYLTRTFAIRAEATSYLQGGSIRKWKDNINTTAGVSFYF